ncbi:MAG: hypothetical protein KDA71_10215 [Planctomycetales bacterium]|nr:hypothetical protein [Planctomycetales bacterium]
MTVSNWMSMGFVACLCFGTSVAGAEEHGADQVTAAWRPMIVAALTGEAEAQQAAVEQMRAAGPPALETLLAVRQQLEAAVAEASTRAANEPTPESEATAQRTRDRLARLDAVIDQVGRQRNCATSRLFWYTDLAEAQREAAKRRRPILSLRMLGLLTDEFSCANSRFFRSTLYSNAEISQYLRDHFVLHWQSVRPVPKVTVDFGDGRKLERTLTGNSAHYILTADGQCVECLPGLYGPPKFLALLQSAESLAQACQNVPESERAELLRLHHVAQRDAIVANWAADLAAINESLSSYPGDSAVSQAPSQRAEATSANNVARADNGRPQAPNAEAASRLAVPKSFAEAPLLRAVTLNQQVDTQQQFVARVETLVSRTDEAVWQQIAARHANDAVLDAASVAMIRRQNPLAAQAMRLAVTKARVEDPVLRLVRGLQSSIALDTVRNEYMLHRQVHDWFAQQTAPADVFALNERVYAELFLTPSSDPWLGLLQPDTYTALQNNGLVLSSE